jgi:hypothetical protein
MIIVLSLLDTSLCFSWIDSSSSTLFVYISRYRCSIQVQSILSLTIETSKREINERILYAKERGLDGGLNKNKKPKPLFIKGNWLSFSECRLYFHNASSLIIEFIRAFK